MDFQTILAIAIIAGVGGCVMIIRKDKKSSGGTGSGGCRGAISKYKTKRK